MPSAILQIDPVEISNDRLAGHEVIVIDGALVQGDVEQLAIEHEQARLVLLEIHDPGRGPERAVDGGRQRVTVEQQSVIVDRCTWR